MTRRLLLFPLLLAAACGGSGGGGDAEGDGGRAGGGGDAGGRPGGVDAPPGSPGVSPVTARNEPEAHFFAAPWPDDSRLDAAGRADVRAFPNPTGSDLLTEYLETISANTSGWSANGCIYLPFTGALDPESLPQTAAASLAADSSAFLERADGEGGRVPLLARFVAEETPFLPGNVVVLNPLLGHVLDEGTPWRAVAGPGLRDAEGLPLSDDAWAEAVFTTQRIIGPIERMREVVEALPEPHITGLRQHSSSDHVYVYEGTVAIPNFQDGEAPYTTTGGLIHWDDDGRPMVDHMEEVRVALAVPRAAMPRSGWPLVIYSHGTGGDYLSFTQDGSADLMAQEGLASLGFDQVLHGDRDPSRSQNPELSFVNLINILASRDNMRQGAADGFQLMRLATGRDGIVVKLDVTFRGQPTYTDPYRVMFLGHSQGAITGSPFVAVEPRLFGAVFSGAGALLRVTLYERKDPIDFHAAAKQILGLPLAEELDFFHPFPTLLQTFIDPADPANYAPYFVLKDTETKGWPTNVLVLQGLLDRQVTSTSSSAFIAATGVDLASPVEQAIPAMEARGQAPRPLPFRQNIRSATAGALQYPGEDHFALFTNAEAQRRTYRFLKTASDEQAVIAR